MSSRHADCKINKKYLQSQQPTPFSSPLPHEIKTTITKITPKFKTTITKINTKIVIVIINSLNLQQFIDGSGRSGDHSQPPMKTY